jgi:hypothetical protein
VDIHLFSVLFRPNYVKHTFCVVTHSIIVTGSYTIRGLQIFAHGWRHWGFGEGKDCEGSCPHFPFSMLFCAMDSIIYVMLLTYCVFAYLEFPRGPWSSNIFTDHTSRWSWTYTHQGSSCHSSWSCLESKVTEHRHILIKCIPFGFIECLSLQLFLYHNTILLLTVRIIRVLIVFIELDKQKMWLSTAW